MTTATYEVSLQWNEGRKGILSSPALKSAIEVATPPEFKKGEPGIWSPEHLLVAAVNGCFMTTLFAIAENSSLDIIDFTSRAKGKLELVRGKYQMTEITIAPTIALKSAAYKEKAFKVLEKTEAACIITNSIKPSVSVVPAIIYEEDLIGTPLVKA